MDLEKEWKMHHIKKNWSYLLIINCMDHIVCILTLKCWFFNTHTHYSRILPSGFQKKIYGYFNRWIGLASTILFLFAFVSLMHLYVRYIFFLLFRSLVFLFLHWSHSFNTATYYCESFIYLTICSMNMLDVFFCSVYLIHDEYKSYILFSLLMCSGSHTRIRAADKMCCCFCCCCFFSLVFFIVLIKLLARLAKCRENKKYFTISV